MKFFLFISLLGATLLGIVVSLKLQDQASRKVYVPEMVQNYQRKVRDHFQKAENANLLFSLITGNKTGISPYTKKAFKKTNLIYLLSPSGIHLAGILFILSFFIKKIKIKWFKRATHLASLLMVFFIPQFYSIHRGAIIRILSQINFFTKLKLSIEVIFLTTFVLAFILGHFQKAPMSFVFSFIFLGTFFSLRNNSKFTLILGLFSTQLIIGLFMGEKVSLLSIPIGLFGGFLFTFLLPFCFLFLASFWIIPINWIEPFIRMYIVMVQTAAKYLTGSFTSSSLFLILGIWILMFMKHSKGKTILLLTCLFLHTNTAMCPAVFTSHL